MLASYSTVLEKLSIVLASQSPRRASILKNNLGLNFEIVVSNFAENIDKSTCPSPHDYVLQTAHMKASDVALSLIDKQKQLKLLPDLIISADTIVVRDNAILEKPEHEQAARDMLKSLSGRSHKVLTGISIYYKNTSFLSDLSNTNTNTQPEYYSYEDFVQETTVKFTNLNDNIINAYVATGEPMDKAGSYGAQGLGSSLVESFDGCYFNVVGFPVNRFCIELIQILERYKG